MKGGMGKDRMDKHIEKTIHEMPFYLFGMGARRKMIFCNHCLFDIFSGKLLYRFRETGFRIIPEEYRVKMQDGEIFENETGVYLRQNDRTISVTEGYLRIPEFPGNPNRNALRILFHEITVNIVEGKPVPNLFVYKKPWYRDAAMMCMVLQRTENLHLVYDWILSLDEAYDRNNAGNCEPDNLGQALYMISLVSDKNHPLVKKILKEAGKWRKGIYIEGLTDGGRHPVYQTKWLKYGLKKLGIPESYEIPETADDYGELFWMEEKENRSKHPAESVIESKGDCWKNSDYPYLEAARAHLKNEAPFVTERWEYPLTWERNASEADYSKNLPFFPQMAAGKICAPHTWHAAELYLWMTED
jgi:hypothetical protein